MTKSPVSSTNNQAISVESPHSNNDVLCGRGGLSNKHPGNRLFRRLVNSNKQVYQRMITPSHKQVLVLSIIESIHNQGGRFIRKEDGEWVEISRREAAIKISQALRESIDDSSSENSSCSSSSSKPRNSTNFKEAAQERRVRANLSPRSSIILAKTLFSLVDGVLMDAYGDEDDFEPIPLNEQQPAPTPVILHEDNFEPIGINHVSTTVFSPQLDDLFVAAITRSNAEDSSIFEGFSI